MKSITSVSGGRTSSYMALNFPTEYNIFSLVRIEDKNCTPKDKKIIQYIEDKIQMPFIATAESDKTLYIIKQLEQDLGKNIIWVTGDTFEQVILNHANALPNRRMRFCTTDMKMTPIFWYCYLYLLDSIDDFVNMNIGYRFDEPNRKTDDFFNFAFSCKNYGKKNQNWIKDFEWRNSITPLKSYRIVNKIIIDFFINKPKYIFPKFSNCAGCFNKNEIELQEQFTLEPEKMNWFKKMEKITKNRFNMNIFLKELEHKDYTYGQISMMESLKTCNCTD